MVNIDAALDAARSEVTGEPQELELRGQKFTIAPLKNTLRLSEAFRVVDVGSVSRALFELLGEDQYQRFLAVDLDDAQVTVFFTEAVKLIGLNEVGESPASNGSSATNGTRSRPTSSASTG